MPNINTMKESKFLKKEDVGSGKLLTIKDVIQENVARSNEPPELKWCLVFEETDLPMVANPTNLQLCAHFLGSEETDNWIGRKVVLYNDPTVSYGVKITGGIRVRAPRGQAASPAKPAAIPSKPVPAPAPVAPPVTNPGDHGPFKKEPAPFDEPPLENFDDVPF